MPITTQELLAFEKTINAQLASHGIVFLLTGHFAFDRVNHQRNKPPITLAELESIFDRLIAKHLKTLWALGDGDSYNIRCTKSHINIPCVIEKQLSSKGSLEYLHSAVTVMRNPNFKPHPGAVDLAV